MKKILTLTTLSLIPSMGFALTASDSASDIAYNGGWTDGTNGGTGFGVWDLTDNNNNPPTAEAGYFTGDSTAGAGDINTSGISFGVYANPAGAFATARRSFSSPLVLGDQFTFQIALNFDNGNKGFTLRTAADQQIFNFNVGTGAQINTAFTNNATLAQYDYGGNDAVIEVSLFYFVGGLQYTVSRTSESGFQGALFTGTITGGFDAPSQFTFYNSGTDNSDAQNNLYFNTLGVSNVPEPSAYALLLGAGVLTLSWLRKRRA